MHILVVLYMHNLIQFLGIMSTRLLYGNVSLNCTSCVLMSCFDVLSLFME